MYSYFLEKGQLSMTQAHSIARLTSSVEDALFSTDYGTGGCMAFFPVVQQM
jgi:hypothetical protein